MPKRKNEQINEQVTEQTEEPTPPTGEKTVTVRYTGKGKCFVLNHLFDPESSRSLTKEVTVAAYERDLKPLQCFEIVL